MDERDKKKRKISMEDESVNWDHDRQKTDGAKIVAIDNPAEFNEVITNCIDQDNADELNASGIADLSAQEFMIVKTKLTFVDKSEGIRRFFKCPASGVQITAPRRFGKSTFMNMLEIFLDIIVDEDAKPVSDTERTSSDIYNMFMNLKLGQKHGDFVKEHCGQYPVILMSLKNVGGETETDVLDFLKKAICETFEKHLYLLKKAPDGSRSFKNENIENVEIFLTYCDEKRRNELSKADAIDALKFLSKILYTHFNKKVVILIDEADAPIMKAITRNVKDETLTSLINLLSDMLSAGLKDNKFLERSLVSSSVRLSGVYSWNVNNQYHALFLQEEEFFETYGFTEQEVHNLLGNNAFQSVKDFDSVKKWYNGYQSLNKDEGRIYNGWSVINYLIYSIKKQKKMFDSYWAKSGWLEILGKLFNVNREIQEAIGKLVKSESISIKVAEPTVNNIIKLKRTIFYPQHQLEEEQVNFFLQLLWDDGLLNAVEKYDVVVVLKIPNLEIKRKIESECYTQSLFEYNYRLKSDNIKKYIKAMKQLLQITSNEEESDEEENEIEESEEGTTNKKCEKAMCNLVNAVSLLFSDDAAVPVNESELHHILFYLAYNDTLFKTQSHRTVVKASEELRDIASLKKLPRRNAKSSYQTMRKEKRERKNECDLCVNLGTVAVIFEFKFLKNDEAENSKAALQQIIEKKYFTLFDKEEYKDVKTKIYVGLCVKNNLNVTAHYLVNDIDLDNAKNVFACRNNR